ncbi:MAG: saccharopine dehydrogenase NADP-binding domain-containing protein [Phycisphaerales bacterium]|nr:saccharopine dehydrogenase NADP-binding domain-containing protein [Phycisphaerales bacterium]
MGHTVVLGGGMVGSIMALDLAQDADRTVQIVDRDEHRLAAVVKQDAHIEPICADLSDCSAISEILTSADLVLGALPSRLGLQTLRTVIESGKPYCDITFTPEDAWELAPLAKAHEVVAVIDCGVAPGMTNLLAGVAARQLQPCTSIDMWVGGIPKHPVPPWNFKAAFSPFDVVDEYLRPARIVRDGQVIVREALSDLDRIDLPQVGMLEAFNTDGLRSLTATLDVPNLVEKTLRYPGHRDLAWACRETGLWSEGPIEVDGQEVIPRDVTCAALFPHWTYAPGEVDLTILRVEARGMLNGAPSVLRWDLYDELDPATGWSSMARTTAFPATIVARLIEQGVISEPGVYAPEALAGNAEVVETLMRELQTRGVDYRATTA